MSTTNSEKETAHAILDGLTYAVLENAVRATVGDDFDEDRIDNLLQQAMNTIPGVRVAIAESINDAILNQLNGWETSYPFDEQLRELCAGFVA